VELLSVLIPCFNEELTLAAIVTRAIEAPVDLRKEIIIVDDGSTDRSAAIAGALQSRFRAHEDIAVITASHPRNRGKGAAVRTALTMARGEVLIIQDADLEYDPADYSAMIRPILAGEHVVVYGRRRHDPRFARSHPWHWRFTAANWLITRITNALYGTRLSDQSTGYKAFTREVARQLRLTSEGFEVCAEITARVRILGYEILEVPIGYRPRTVAEGKKIRAADAWRIVWTLVTQRMKGTAF
jgi:glycosyltransferase involved in cell wall biosynthesis